MYCRNCGKTNNDDDTQYCIHCGNLLSSDSSYEQNKSLVNNQSGEDIPKASTKNNRAIEIAALVGGLILGVMVTSTSGTSAGAIGFIVGAIIGAVGAYSGKIVSAAFYGLLIYGILEFILLFLILPPGDPTFLIFGVIVTMILGAIIGGIGGFIGTHLNQSS